MDTATAAGVYTDLNLPSISIAVTAMILFVSLPVCAVLGFAIGHRVRKRLLRARRDIDVMVAETTLGAFLALLGLLLAFTFGNSLNYFNDRKVAMTTEANAIGTAFLRADLLAEPQQLELKDALLDYARTRVSSGSGTMPGQESALRKLDRSLQLQAQLWPLALEATAEPMPPATRSFVLAAINDVLDAHTVRIAKLSLPVSKYANAMMFVSALAAVFLLGNRAGMVGRKLTWRTFFFSGFLFVVMITIVDTQRATEGLIVIDQTPLKAVIFDMETTIR
ncbi:MAG TPA: hypothetical protein DDY14_11215 [Chromatiaceae bacterium]|jgi:hypothetical protein|nr:MAG: hypothetical protein N838_07875 [Thiohalocapsa sp. PB-PSB1]QQO52486.1 MAG: hypothetical protein N838_02945 [Thiohalocapsa sp. PB-PSB1]HBG95860.1 hypothetical protein [Chromatiaceae bacterium]